MTPAMQDNYMDAYLRKEKNRPVTEQQPVICAHPDWKGGDSECPVCVG